MDIDIGKMLSLDTQSFVGRSVAVLGITGSGKTNTAAVLIEELLSNGLPLTIVDIEGEYWGLKERYDLLIAGRSEHAELEIGPENAAQLAEISVQRSISVILDLSDYTQEETASFLEAYFQRLWEVAGQSRKPYEVVLEEAHEFVPQGGRSPLKQILTRIALRGRKRGLGIILMSQRSAKVEKDVLTQASLLFLHRVVHPVDMHVYKDLIPLLPAQVETLVSSLSPGQAVVISGPALHVVAIRLRHTFHAGATPVLGSIEPELRHIDATMLQELKVLLRPTRTNTDNVEARQARHIQELEMLLATKDAEIARLNEQVALLGKLSVTVASPERLDIRHAAVETMQVAQGHPVVESTLAQNHASPAKPALPPAPFNERKFASLKQRIADLPRRQRLMLRVLTEHQKMMPLSELAAWLQVDESSLSKNPPTDLLRMRLIERERRSGGYHYRSALRAYLEREFPGSDVEALLHRLF